MTRIVVGVDGSEGSLAALRWAAQQARLHRDGLLELVLAYGGPAGWLPTGELDPVGDHVEAAAAARLDEAVEQILGGDPDVDVVRSVRRGPPARVLLDASAEADLLVVGSRGLGGFEELLLGSVSHSCVLHARCPVVVVRAATSG